MRRHVRISTFSAVIAALAAAACGGESTFAIDETRVLDRPRDGESRRVAARRIGWLRAFGVAMVSVFGCAVVAASRWGVNPLGAGLHSCGFTSGVAYALLGFFVLEGVAPAAGGAHRLPARSLEVSHGETVG